jgi:glyoxylase-like metal-dependent hydrolase (beta-lactamase superfamily II)
MKAMLKTHVPRSLLLAAAALVFSGADANAGAPMGKGPQAGWFRIKVGDFEVTALSDGTADLPMDKLLTNTTPEKVTKALTEHFMKVPVETSVNAFVVNTGTKLVMIDSGAGSLFGPTLGKTVASLKAAGYKPEQIDEIYITHMHADHVGGVAANGKALFPNATIRAGKAEGEFWLTQANMDKAPDQMKDFFKGAMASMKPYAKKYKPIEGDNVELVPGIHALAAAGHTPGHTIYEIESKGEKMVFCGDLMHVAAVQFADPSVTIQFDSDSKAAAPQRQKLYADAAAKGYYVAFTHVSFPGIGHVRKEGSGYEWIPVNYSNK